MKYPTDSNIPLAKTTASVFPTFKIVLTYCALKLNWFNSGDNSILYPLRTPGFTRLICDNFDRKVKFRRQTVKKLNRNCIEKMLTRCLLSIGNLPTGFGGNRGLCPTSSLQKRDEKYKNDSLKWIIEFYFMKLLRSFFFLSVLDGPDFFLPILSDDPVSFFRW